VFGIGGQELLVIAVVALLAVGPKRMPTLMKAIGKTVRELRNATRNLTSQVGLDEVLGDVRDLRDPLNLRGDAPTPKKKAKAPGAKPVTARQLEQPEEGVDLAESRAREDDA